MKSVGCRWKKWNRWTDSSAAVGGLLRRLCSSFCLSLCLCVSSVAGGESSQFAVGEIRAERYIAPGVKLIALRRQAGPWEIRVIEIERPGGPIAVRPAPAAERGLALEPLSAIANRVSTETNYAVGAVNGDYFVQQAGPGQGDPLGIAVIDGEIVSTPFPRAGLVLDALGRASIQLFRMDAWVERPDGQRLALNAVNEVRGADRLLLYTSRFGARTRTNGFGTEVTLGDLAVPLRSGKTYRGVVRAVQRKAGDSEIPNDGVVLSGHGSAGAFLEGLAPGDAVSFRIDFQPALPEGAHVIGGGPRLLRDGRDVVAESAREERVGASLVEKRHPRTAVGIDGDRLLLVTVDGRQPGHSEGMTLVELTSLMRDLGCKEALNLDGGGSTSLWVRGAIENRPSDGGERRIANALVVFSRAPKGPPVRLVLTPREVSVLAGTTLPLSAFTEDESYNPVRVAPTDVTWELPADLGAVDASGLLTTAVGVQPDTTPDTLFRAGSLQASHGDFRATIPVRVYLRPPRLEIAAVGAPIPAAAPPRETGNTAASPREPGNAARFARPIPPASRGTNGNPVVRTPAVTIPPGATHCFTVRAADELGRPMTIPTGAITWECDPALGTIDADGRLTAGAMAATGTVAATVLGVRSEIRVGVQER